MKSLRKPSFFKKGLMGDQIFANQYFDLRTSPFKVRNSFNLLMARKFLGCLAGRLEMTPAIIDGGFLVAEMVCIPEIPKFEAIGVQVVSYFSCHPVDSVSIGDFNHNPG